MGHGGTENISKPESNLLCLLSGYYRLNNQHWLIKNSEDDNHPSLPFVPDSKEQAVLLGSSLIMTRGE